jgi:hypothetical protein
MKDFLLRVLNQWAAAPAGSGEKKPPGGRRFSGFASLLLRAFASPAAKVGREPKVRKKTDGGKHGGRM